MGSARQLLGFVAAAVLAVVVLFFVFGAVFVAIAIVAPLVGLGFLVTRLRRARMLWKSRGRFEHDGGVRVIEANRARGLAIGEGLRGLGVLALTLVPTFFVLGPATAIIPALGAGLLSTVAGGVLERRLAEGARPVDVLPPE